jgi:hypothetical protein
LRAPLVAGLSIGLALMSLAFAYAFYMRHREQVGAISPAAGEAVAVLFRAHGLACSQLCTVESDEGNSRMTIGCGIGPARDACTQTVQYAITIAESAKPH